MIGIYFEIRGSGKNFLLNKNGKIKERCVLIHVTILCQIFPISKIILKK